MKSFRSESGYALPSVLMLVSLLSLVALSILSLQYLKRQQILFDIAKVKAEYAAESGVARALAELSGRPISALSLSQIPERYLFEDGTSAAVDVRPWGVYLLVRSEGLCHAMKSTRIAVVAKKPPLSFDNALVMGNPAHQLVMTGSTSVVGDVAVGKQGVSVGSLPAVSTPSRLPVLGRVVRMGSTDLMSVDQNGLSALISEMSDLLQGNTHALSRRHGVNVASVSISDSGSIGGIADSVDVVLIRGRGSIGGTISRRSRPLYLVGNDSVTIKPNAKIEGPIAIIAPGGVLVQRGAVLRHCVVYSLKRVRLAPFASIVAQLIAPSILVDSFAVAAYPSALISVGGSKSSTTPREIVVKAGGRIEGFVGLMGLPKNKEDIVTIDQSATIAGAAFSYNRMTLDGTVTGTVMTDDFFFYLAPTNYIGWLRSARIDRKGQPPGFLVPPVVGGDGRLDILEWI